MSELAKKNATYEDLCGLPENMIGEIVDGELIATPRPAPVQVRVAMVLGNEIGPRYDRFGKGGGPGGWIFLDEVEVKLGEHILVPDLAGWKEERFPTLLEHNWVPVAPDWICEILSPSSLRTDKIKKIPVYAQFGDAHAMVDRSPRQDPRRIQARIRKMVPARQLCRRGQSAGRALPGD